MAPVFGPNTQVEELDAAPGHLGVSPWTERLCLCNSDLQSSELRDKLFLLSQRGGFGGPMLFKLVLRV